MDLPHHRLLADECGHIWLGGGGGGGGCGGSIFIKQFSISDTVRLLHDKVV